MPIKNHLQVEMGQWQGWCGNLGLVHPFYPFVLLLLLRVQAESLDNSELLWSDWFLSSVFDVVLLPGFLFSTGYVLSAYFLLIVLCPAGANKIFGHERKLRRTAEAVGVIFADLPKGSQPLFMLYLPFISL